MISEEIFIDANSFLYLLTETPKKYEMLLEMLNSDIELATSYSVLNEVKYKLLYIFASEEFKTKHKYEIVNHIKKDREFRKKIIIRYLKFYRSISSRVKILSDDGELASCSLIVNYGLLPNDASIVAIMKKNQIKSIITSDSDFEKISWIKIIKP